MYSIFDITVLASSQSQSVLYQSVTGRQFLLCCYNQKLELCLKNWQI